MARTVQELAREAAAGRVSVEEHTAKVLEEAKKANKQYSYFNVIAEQQALERAKELDKLVKKKKAKGKLFGVPVSVKDNICVKGIESRAGSKILDGYAPLFNATPVGRLLEEGAVVVGKTSQDEFGFGSFSKNTGIGFEKPKNPFDRKRVCGGSSGGSAGFTQITKHTHISLAESTGGSIACPASFCGVFGFTPTYGRVSRHGLIDYASSLDKIGTTTKTVADAGAALEIISGKDEKDFTTMAQFQPSAQEKQKIVVGVVKELFEKAGPEVRGAVEKKISWLSGKNVEAKQISLPLSAKYGLPAYYILAMTEASTNLAKYCGMRYGYGQELKGSFDEYFSSVRTSALGEEAKLRIIIGTFARMAGFREAYYLKAAKARTKIIEEYKKALGKVDFLLNPTMPIVAPTFAEAEKLSPMQNYAMDLCTAPANLAGMPHFSTSIGFAKKEKLPIGLMATANHFEEAKLLGFAKTVEGCV